MLVDGNSNARLLPFCFEHHGLEIDGGIQNPLLPRRPNSQLGMPLHEVRIGPDPPRNRIRILRDGDVTHGRRPGLKEPGRFLIRRNGENGRCAGIPVKLAGKRQILLVSLVFVQQILKRHVKTHRRHPKGSQLTQRPPVNRHPGPHVIVILPRR